MMNSVPTQEEQPDAYREFAEFYDLYVGGWLGDLPFYLEYARSMKGPVLEIGAGSGRLTLPLVRAGVELVAVDASPSMLAILKRRLAEEADDVRERVRVVEADARRLAVGETFKLVMVPFYTFNYFLTSEDQRAALRRVAEHTSEAGIVLIDVFLPLSRIEHCSTEPVLKVDTVDTQTGNHVRGWNRYEVDTESQIETRRHVFEVTEPDGRVTRKEFTTRRRYFFPYELEAVFADNGFEVELIFSGYDGKPPTAESEELLYVLRRRNGADE